MNKALDIKIQAEINQQKELEAKYNNNMDI